MITYNCGGKELFLYFPTGIHLSIFNIEFTFYLLSILFDKSWIYFAPTTATLSAIYLFVTLRS